jgi:cytoskeletal protein CcmA (bactofilin family)
MAEREDAFVNSIIGEGAKFTGDIELSGLIRIDGDFSGLIKKADRVLIGKTGRVKSSIKARVVVVGGAVMGDIIAEERLTILSTAMVVGNVKAPNLAIEEGVVFHGLCEVIVPEESKKNEEISPSRSFTVEW